jgi:hypothetical protein
MSKVRRGLYHTANVVLPLREVGSALSLVVRSLRATALVTLTALTGSVRTARHDVEAAQAGEDAPEARELPALVPQWWAGLATAVLGLLCWVFVWMTADVAGKLALSLIGSGLLGAGVMIAGASAYAIQRARRRVDSAHMWIRRPSLWTPY